MNWLRRNGLFLVAVLAISGGGLWIKSALRSDSGQHSGASFDIGGPFALTAHDGRAVTQASWPGKLLLITFGYRYCPDVCPTNLQTGASAVELLGKDGEAVQQLFVTIDPERDDAAGLAPYVSQFSPRLIGLTGSAAEIAAAARTFRVYYRKVAGAAPDAYTMDHSAFTFLANDRGTVIKLFGHDTSPDQMAEGIRQVLSRKAS
ncbi:MAG: SCO family protein [Rhodospirillaceae bacterium]